MISSAAIQLAVSIDEKLIDKEFWKAAIIEQRNNNNMGEKDV